MEMSAFFAGWWASRRLYILCFVGFLLVIGGLSVVFSIEKALVGYALWLLGAFFSMVVVIDLAVERQRYQQVLEGNQAVLWSAVEVFLGARQADLEGQLQRLREEQVQSRRDLEDYYTLWAHQMKIPIAASRLVVENLSAGQERQLLEQELFKIGQYTDFVLNYLRLQSFHEDLVLEEQRVEELVRRSVKKFSLFFIQKKISLELGDVSGVLVTDKRWFSLLLEQFLSNAVKYTQNGCITIYLEEGDLVIADTGIGISQADIERVFDRGFSGYNGRVNQQSSGLGLYIAKQIGEALGISIQLTSQIGQGTQVRLGLRQEVYGNSSFLTKV